MFVSLVLFKGGVGYIFSKMFAKVQAKEEAERKARVAAVQRRIAQEQSIHVLLEKEETY